MDNVSKGRQLSLTIIVIAAVILALVLAIVWELALISVLVHIPSVRDSFGIHIPSLADLGIIFGFSLFVFLAMEALKALLRRRMAVPNIQGLPPQRKKEG